MQKYKTFFIFHPFLVFLHFEMNKTEIAFVGF